MWINLEREELEQMAKAARGTGEAKDAALADKIDAAIADAFDPANADWVDKAKDIHQDEGCVELDEQSDGSAMVSDNGENGAYVLAWVFVDYDDMGIPYPNAEDGDSENEDEDEAEPA